MESHLGDAYRGMKDTQNQKGGGEEMERDCLRNANVTVDGSDTGSLGPFLHIFSSMQSISGANLPQLSS